jgi:hypothetical protein
MNWIEFYRIRLSRLFMQFRINDADFYIYLGLNQLEY